MTTPTLTPSFRGFLPAWLARQPWYRGDGAPEVRPVGFFRFEDPAGEVGIETHVISAGGVTYQIPMTYRGAPLDGGILIVTAEHSLLGPRWIYQGETDPLWRKELLRLVRGNGTVAGTRGSEFEAHGTQLADFADDEVDIELARVVTPTEPNGPDVVGILTLGDHHLATIRRPTP